MTPEAVVTFAGLLIKEAEKQGLKDKFLNLLKQSPRVIILGATGTGKTNFLRALTDYHAVAIEKESRTLFAEAKNLIVDKSPFRFIDTPGDQPLSDRRNDAIREAMSARDGVAGVINVVSYGYHEYNIPPNTALRNGAADIAFLKQHRQFEIDQLAEWTGLLGDRHTIDWLMTVVTKADLWWNEKDTVLSYYKQGAYNTALGGARSVKNAVLPFSSVFHKFYRAGAMSGNFDDEDKTTLSKNLIEGIVKIMLKKQV